MRMGWRQWLWDPTLRLPSASSKLQYLYDLIYIACKHIKILTVFKEENFYYSCFLDGEGKEIITCRV